MKSSDRSVLMFLISVGGMLERGCWHRQKKIATAVGLSVSTVQRALYRLEAAETIRVQHRHATTNLYFVSREAKSRLRFDWSGKNDVGSHQNDVTFLIKESKTPKESSSAAEPFSERKPRRAPESADDIGYREQFAEALLGLGCVLGDMRPGLIEAAAREARRSGLSADRAAQVYESLDWTRIANADNFIGLFVTIFRDELSKSHRLRESESRRNVSLKIAQPVQSFVPDPELEEVIREHEARQRALQQAAPVEAPKPAAPTMTAEDRQLYAEFVRLYPFASINQFQAFKAEHFAVVAPTSSEQGRVSQRSLDRAIPPQEKQHGLPGNQHQMQGENRSDDGSVGQIQRAGVRCDLLRKRAASANRHRTTEAAHTEVADRQSKRPGSYSVALRANAPRHGPGKAQWGAPTKRGLGELVNAIYRLATRTILGM